jgi:hypothetical protein
MYAFKVLDYTTITGQMKMRFTASDSTIASLPNNGQSVSEAALDEFQVWDGPLTTGINHTEIVSGIYLYPNPAIENLTVSFNIESEKEVELQLTNSLGQQVWKKDLGKVNSGSHQYAVDVRNLSAGVYQLRIKTNDGSFSKKVSVIR